MNDLSSMAVRRLLSGLRLHSAIAALVISLVFSPAVAANALEDGIRAYRAGNLESALQLFSAALAENPADSIARFNRALTLYRLGRYDEARAAFLALRELALREAPDMDMIAEYHLGLVDARQGRRASAASHFERVMRGDNARLATLARAARGRLASEQTPSPRAFAMLGIGFDDNRNRVNENEEIPGRDPEAAFTDTAGQLLLPLDALRPRYDVLLAGQHRDYMTDDALDQTVIGVALRHALAAGHWRIVLAAETEHTLLRDNSLVNALGVGIEASREQAFGRLRLRYEPAHVSAEGDFDYLDGARHQATIVQELRLGPNALRLGWALEQSSQASEFEEDIIYGQAPRRHGPFVQWDYPLTPRLQLGLRAAWRDSRYETDDPGTEKRHDELLQLGAILRLQLNESWNLLLDFRRFENHSSVDTYRYDRNTLFAGFEWRPRR